VRDRCYGMTSCGTGGIWAITSPVGVGEYFFGRTMIEDTSTTHMKFFEGKCSVYLPPKRGTTDQLMRAVPKVSANYLEALERWDTGAVQIFLSLSVPSPRFWLVLFFMLTLTTAVVLPVFTTANTQNLFRFVSDYAQGTSSSIVVESLKGSVVRDCIFVAISITVFVVTFVTVAMLSIFSPRTLNYLLRHLVILFNSIYPFNAVATIFWLSLPPWLCFTANFPFSLSVYPATIGSLILRLTEFAIVGKMKKDAEEQGATLEETSIYRSQQLDLVTVPIKLRAIMKGFQTGMRDIYSYHDNSWWESFGGGHAKSSVQMWLIVVCSVMIISLIVGPIQLIVALVQKTQVSAKLFPVLFGMVQAALNLWVLYDPTKYILQNKSDRPSFSLRYVNLGIIAVITIVALSMHYGSQ